MQGRNYTNPEDRGRFGFSASGKFNAPYKLEGPIIGISIAAAIVAVVIIIISIIKIIRTNPTGVQSGIMFEALVGGIVAIAACAAVLLSALVIVKFVGQGIACSYIADDEKFTATIGGTYHTIYYKDVQNVHFIPRTFLGSVRGYDVTVKINGVNEEYSIVSSGYISEQSTPFYIIKERMEMNKIENERKRAAAAEQERSELFRKRAMQKPAKLEKKAETSKSAAAAPTENVSEAKQVSLYTDLSGRDRDVNDIVAQGTFREVMKPRKAVIIGVIGLIVYIVLFNIVYNVMGKNSGAFGMQVGSVAMIILAPFYAGTIINFLRDGDEYRYSANGREFVIYSKGKPDEHILYSDVQSVDYKPMEFLWFIKGYRVEILTRYGVLKYNYVFPGMGKMRGTDVLPFEEIRIRIGQQQ